MMETFGYPEVLHLTFQEKDEVTLGSAMTKWHIKCVYDKSSPIANIPVLVRVDKVARKESKFWFLRELLRFCEKSRRRPWPPNNGDMHTDQYRRKDGKSQAAIDFIPSTSAWAFDQLLRHGKRLRVVEWPRGMHLKDVEMSGGRCCILLTLPNGTVVKNEFRPDPNDLVSVWEIYEP